MYILLFFLSFLWGGSTPTAPSHQFVECGSRFYFFFTSFLNCATSFAFLGSSLDMLFPFYQFSVNIGRISLSLSLSFLLLNSVQLISWLFKMHELISLLLWSPYFMC